MKESDKKVLVTLLTGGMSFRKGSKEVYKAASKFRVLHWDNKSNLVSSLEKNFDKAEEALGFFLEEIGES